MTRLLDRRGCAGTEPGANVSPPTPGDPHGIPMGHGAGVPSVHRNTEGRPRCPVNLRLTPYPWGPGAAVPTQAISQAFKHQAELSEGSTAVPRPLSLPPQPSLAPRLQGRMRMLHPAGAAPRCSPTQPPSPRTTDLPFGTGCAVNKKAKKESLCCAFFSI